MRALGSSAETFAQHTAWYAKLHAGNVKNQGMLDLRVSDRQRTIAFYAVPEQQKDIPAIRELIDAQRTDPNTILQHIVSTFRTEHYAGMLKGPQATIADRAGNDYDLSNIVLLVLRQLGYTAHFIVREVLLSERELLQYAGISLPERAFEYLNLAGAGIAPGSGGYYISQCGVLFSLGAGDVEVFPALKETNYGAPEGSILPPNISPIDAMRIAGDRLPHEVLLEQPTHGASANPVRPNVVLHRSPNATAQLGALGKRLFLWEELPQDRRFTLEIQTKYGKRLSLSAIIPMSALYQTPLLLSFRVVNDELQHMAMPSMLQLFPSFLLRMQEELWLGKTRIATGITGFPGLAGTLSLHYRQYNGARASDVTPAMLGARTVIALNPRTRIENGGGIGFAASAQAYQRQIASAEVFHTGLQKASTMVAEMYHVHFVKTPTIIALTEQTGVSFLAGQPFLVQPGMAQIDVVEAGALFYGHQGKEPGRQLGALLAATTSALEHRAVERAYGIPAVSTAKLFVQAARAGIPPSKLALKEAWTFVQKHSTLRRINTYADTSELWLLPEQACQDWRGVASVIHDPVRGSWEYLISGGLRGGQTCLPVLQR